jgi:collagen beta-1,O-galactosyltransferase
VGCALAHLHCWKVIAKSTGAFSVVLEDDAVIPSRFSEVVNDLVCRLERIDPYWHLLYLGRFRLEGDEDLVDGFVRPGYSHCTYAYLLSRSGAKILCDSGFEQMIMPVDEFLPAMYLTHPRADLADCVKPQLRAYALTVDVVHQRPKEEAGSDTEESPFAVTN